MKPTEAELAHNETSRKAHEAVRLTLEHNQALAAVLKPLAGIEGKLAYAGLIDLYWRGRIDHSIEALAHLTEQLAGERPDGKT